MGHHGYVRRQARIGVRLPTTHPVAMTMPNALEELFRMRSLRFLLSGAASTRSTVPNTRVAEGWRRWKAFCALCVVVGVFAILLPMESGCSAGTVLAIPLLLDALVQCCHAVHIRRHPGVAWRLLGGAISAAGATVLLSVPLDDVMPLGVAMGVFLLHSSLARFFLSAFLEPQNDRNWLSHIGVTGVLLGLGLLLFGAEAKATLLGPLVGLVVLLDGARLAVTACPGHRQRADVPPALPFHVSCGSVRG
jgi:uncharacterized membrane protein HdeD (DUF308 family)